MARIDTRLESQGSEFLVLGRLLVEGVETHKMYTNYPGYDLVAVNPAKGRTARIQVKSRYSTNWDGIIVRNFDFDFLVLVALNRGYTRPRKNGDTGIKDPDFFVLPVSYMRKVRDPNNAWGKIGSSRMKDLPKWEDRWDLIKKFLNMNDGKK